MPGNKKSKRKDIPVKDKVACRIVAVMTMDRHVDTQAQSVSPRCTMATMECMISSAMEQGAFDSVMSQFKQVKHFKREMLKHKSWFYRHIVALFI